MFDYKSFLRDRNSQTASARDIFQELAATAKRHNYQATPDDVRAIDHCTTELDKLSMTEIAAGALGGFVLGSFVRQRIALTVMGIFLCYQVRDGRPAVNSCMQRMMSLPTPLGSEMVEIVKSRDPDHPLLIQLADRSGLPDRIAIPAAQHDIGNSNDVLSHPSAHSSASGDSLWAFSDPFDLCFQKPADSSNPVSASSQTASSSKAQARREQQQALYRAQREARQRHQEGKLTNDGWA